MSGKKGIRKFMVFASTGFLIILISSGCGGIVKHNTELSKNNSTGIQVAGGDALSKLMGGGLEDVVAELPKDCKYGDIRELSKVVGFEVKLPKVTLGEKAIGFYLVKGRKLDPSSDTKYVILLYPKFLIAEARIFGGPLDFRAMVENFKDLNEKSTTHPAATPFIADVGGNDALVWPACRHVSNDPMRQKELDSLPKEPAGVKWCSGDLYFELGVLRKYADSLSHEELLKIARSI